jgi:hypothetical protein
MEYCEHHCKVVEHHACCRKDQKVKELLLFFQKNSKSEKRAKNTEA